MEAQMDPEESFIETEFPTKDILNLLLKRIKTAQYVEWGINSLKQFTSNNEVSTRCWLELYEELTEIIDTFVRHCLHSPQMLENFIYEVTFLIEDLAQKGHPLSSSLFNRCAKKLLEIALKNNASSCVPICVLQAISVLCEKSPRINTSRTFNALKSHLVCLAGKVHSLSDEAQIFAYEILRRSLSSKSEARSRAATWFRKWPSLVRTFINGYSDDLSKAAGDFINEIFALSKAKASTVPLDLFQDEFDSTSTRSTVSDLEFENEKKRTSKQDGKSDLSASKKAPRILPIKPFGSIGVGMAARDPSGRIANTSSARGRTPSFRNKSAQILNYKGWKFQVYRKPSGQLQYTVIKQPESLAHRWTSFKRNVKEVRSSPPSFPSSPPHFRLAKKKELEIDDGGARAREGNLATYGYRSALMLQAKQKGIRVKKFASMFQHKRVSNLFTM